MRDSPPVKVAMTLEQCWHRVPGGTATAAVETARALRVGHGLDLVGVSARHAGAPAPEFTPPIDVRALPLPRLALYEAWHRLRRPAVERVTGPVDVIHATGWAMPPRTRPIVFTIHDLAFVHDPLQFTVHGLRFFNTALRLALDEADGVLCSSRATMADCVDVGFDAGRLRHVPLGVRATRASDADQRRVRATYGLGRFVLTVGTIEPRKNLPTLIDAFRRLDRADVTLAVVGPPGWDVRLADHLVGLDGRVRALGFVPAADLAALYAAAEVSCYPSLREGFGLPVLEAMAQGTPVVTSRGTSTEEVAGDAALLVDPRDPDAIAGALALVLDDHDLAMRLAAAGLVRAGELTWERTARLTAAAYAEAASGGGSQA